MGAYAPAALTKATARSLRCGALPGAPLASSGAVVRRPSRPRPTRAAPPSGRPPAPRSASGVGLRPARGRRRFASSRSRSRARYSLRSSSGSNSPSSPEMICRASASSSFFTRVAATGSSISSWLFTSSARNSVSSASALALRPDQAELLLAGEHERPEADDVRTRASPRAAARTAAAVPRSPAGTR